MTTNKYPNADTSPERLAHIQNCFLFTDHGIAYDENEVTKHSVGKIVRDLLAMLHERAQLQCLSCFEMKPTVYCKDCVKKAMDYADTLTQK